MSVDLASCQAEFLTRSTTRLNITNLFNVNLPVTVPAFNNVGRIVSLQARTHR
jgi:hypothetical protein